MSWNGPADFFAMGGYGLYVWGAYAMTLACMLVDPWLASRRHRRAAQLLPPARIVPGSPPPPPSPDGGGRRAPRERSSP